MLSFIILILYFQKSFSYDFLGLNDEISTNDPQWPEEYYFKGEEIILQIGIKETFEIWYSTRLNRSRIDYYGGVNTKFYYGDTNNSSSRIYVIFPYSTEEKMNEIECMSEYNEETTAHNFLPGVTNLTYLGVEEYLNRRLKVWERSAVLEDELKAYIKIYAYEKDGFDIPVQVIQKSFNLLKGSIDKNTITNYYGFESTSEDDIFDAELSNPKCADRAVNDENSNIFQNLKPGIFMDADFAFNRFKVHHNKFYEGDEHEVRKAIFHKNWKNVEEHNKKNLGYRLELNTFADRTDEEFQQMTGLRPSKHDSNYAMDMDNLKLAEGETLPDEVDLRLDGDITPVKNQANCGSCWAFCTTAAVEGALARRNGGRNLDLSEQSLIDCAWGFENSGCHGGTLEGAMKYVLAHGIPLESEYGPYLMKDGFCEIQNMTKVYIITGFGRVTPRNIESMKVALYKYGPVVVAVHASENMKLYSSGIFYDIDCAGERVNHGVTVVGYGIRDGDTYWIVKNSWGESWGEDGYILMSATNNNCLLLDMAVYPIV